MAFSSFTDWLKRNSSPVKAVQNVVNQPAPAPKPSAGAGSTGGGGAWSAPNPLTYSAQPYQSSQNLNPYPMADGAGGYTPVQGSYGGQVDNMKQQEDGQKANILNAISNRFNSLRSVFDGLFKSVDDIVNEKKSSADKNYNQQAEDLTKQYGKTAEQQDLMYGARGLQNSSYRENAQSDAADIFTRNYDSINEGRQQTYGDLGKFAATTKAGLNSSLQGAQDYFNNINSSYGSLGLGDLQGAESDFGSLAGNLQQQAAGLQTNPQFVDALNKISPVQNAGTAQLAQRLQTLVSSSAPIFAKRQIAQGLIKASNLTDENAKGYWQNQFEDLLRSNGSV